MCSNFVFVGQKGRLPGGLLTAILKKYWPGLYPVGPAADAPKRLATKWEHYEAAKMAGVMTDDNGDRFVPTCAQIVQYTFWVRLFWPSFVHGSSPHRANL